MYIHIAIIIHIARQISLTAAAKNVTTKKPERGLRVNSAVRLVLVLANSPATGQTRPALPLPITEDLYATIPHAE